MLKLADHQITGEILGKPFFGKTLPPAEGGTLPSGIFLLYPPDKDPVFGAFVLAVRPGPGTAKGIWFKKSVQAIGTFKMAAGADTFIKQTARAVEIEKRPAGSSRMVEWKMPGSRGREAAQFGDQVKPGTGEAFKVLPPGGAAQFPKMQPPDDSAQFPKMQPRGGPAEFPKMQPAPQHVDGAPSALVLSQRAIPGRYCLVVVAGFADLLSALRAAGGAQILIR
jgi:hypothetical protein